MRMTIQAALILLLTAAPPVSAKEVGDGLDHARHPRLAAHQNHLINVGRVEAGCFKGIATGIEGPFDQVADEVLELAPGQAHL